MRTKYLFRARQQYASNTFDLLRSLIPLKVIKTRSKLLFERMPEILNLLSIIEDENGARNYYCHVKSLFDILPKQLKLDWKFFDLFVKQGIVAKAEKISVVRKRKLIERALMARNLNPECGLTKPILHVIIMATSKYHISSNASIFNCLHCLQAEEKHNKCLDKTFSNYTCELKTQNGMTVKIVRALSALMLTEIERDEPDETHLIEESPITFESYWYAFTDTDLHLLAKNMRAKYILPSKDNFAYIFAKDTLDVFYAPIPRLSINSSDSLILNLLLMS